MNTALVISLFLIAPLAGRQKVTASTPAKLSAGVDMGEVSIRAIRGDTHPVNFVLTTSWIPGDGHKGFFRYKITATIPGLDLKSTIDKVEEIRGCSFTLVLYDSGGFKLRDIDLALQRVIGDGGDVTKLDGNEMTQMDLGDYKTFLAGQRWTIGFMGGVCGI